MKDFLKINFHVWFLSLGIFLLGQGNVWAMGKRPPAPSDVQTAEVPKIVLTIGEAYARALRQSETVAISREAIAQTRADWLKAAGEAIGDGDLVMTDTFQDAASGGDFGGSSVGSTLTSAERRERRMVFSQPIFQGFKSLGSVIGAGSLSRQRKQEYRRSKEVLFLDVSQTFYEYHRLREDLKTIEKTHGLFEDRVKQLKEREKVGRSRISEIATARSRMKALEAELARTRRLFSIAGTVLEFYTGIPKEEADYKDLSLPKDLEAPLDIKIIASQRADVKAAFQAMKTAKQAMVIAQSGLWPKITMDANHYEKREGFQSGIDWDVLFKINVPLYKGGTTLGEVRSKYSDWRKAKLNYSLTKRRAELEIKEAYDNWRGSVEQDKAFKDAVRAAEENYKLQQEDYAKNLVNNLDVLDAMEEYFSMAREAHQTYYTMKQNYWRYKTAIGKCCSVESLPAAGETEVEP